MSMQKRPSAMGRGFGVGHGGNSKLPPLQVRTMLPEFYLGMEPGTKVYQLGQCSVFVSPPFLGKGWHVSIAHPKRYPTWDELAKAWYEGVPDAKTRRACMVLPPAEEYINLHNFCLQVHELIEQQGSFTLPETAMK